jgi:hypothetical protein
VNNRKANNSILVLATLGVYLGLVLVGATPQVLAQAAMARQFNVKDEIEVKDDLDKKPDGCDLGQLRENVTDNETTFLWFNRRSISEYTWLIKSVLDAYPDEVDGIDVSWQSVGEFRPSRKVTVSLAYPFGFLDEESSRELNSDVLYVGNGLPGKSFSFSLLRNAFGNDFRFESKQIPYDAPLVRALYASALDLQKCEDWSHDDVILRNTQLVVEGDHLVIITRLPRGSLDALLASDAK